MFSEMVLGPDQHLYRYKSLLVNVHWHGFELEHFKKIHAACAQIVREHKEMTSIVVMRGEFNFSLSADARKASAVLVKEFENTNKGQAILVEASGFRASLARSLLTGVNLVVRSKAQQKVFQEVRPCVEWLCGLDTQSKEIRALTIPILAEFQKLLARLPT
jgi:hypothetical protein